MQQKEENNSQRQSIYDSKQKMKFKADLVTTLQRWRENDSNQELSEIVWLINERDDKKFNWAYQKLLPWDESFDSGLFQRESMINEGEAIKSEIQNHLGAQQLQSKQCQKLEIKTPQLLNPYQTPCLPLRSDFQLEIKQFKKDQKGGKCNCKKSKCLKMYCECFRSGKECQDCGCLDCKNNVAEHELRRTAIKMVKEKEPTAFTSISQYKGCKCSKSRCLKGYCECFLNGHICGKYCRCRDCLNCKNLWTSRLGKQKQQAQ